MSESVPTFYIENIEKKKFRMLTWIIYVAPQVTIYFVFVIYATSGGLTSNCYFMNVSERCCYVTTLKMTRKQVTVQKENPEVYAGE